MKLPGRKGFLRAFAKLRKNTRRMLGGSLTRRIVLLNLLGLFALLYGILYLNQFQAGLIDARVQSLLIQGEILARAISGTATVDSNSIELDTQNDQPVDPDDDRVNANNFSINPARVAPVIRRLLQPARLRARVYDNDGLLLLDSRFLYAPGQASSNSATAAAPQNAVIKAWQYIRHFFNSQELPSYVEYGITQGKSYPEIVKALSGSPGSVVRVNDRDELIVSVAIPVQRQQQMVGALLLSTFSGDIDAIVHAERMAILRVFLVSALVMVILSVLMASTIAGPLQKLAEAANRVRRGTRQREQIPDFTSRLDEVGNLSGALRDMTGALYSRIEAIESFAADVAHELKNPLTSLRSAIETLPLAKKDEDKARLLAIVNHDVLRLDRLITDISAASRLDAELQRQKALPLDLRALLTTLIGFYGETEKGSDQIVFSVDTASQAQNAFTIVGFESRLGQVFGNLIDNALSFSPADAKVFLHLSRVQDRIIVTVEDEGPGFSAQPVERIFERFFTDRPEHDFGAHSGLGLSIARQIIEAHGGTIDAHNRSASNPATSGARFVISFPAATA